MTLHEKLQEIFHDLKRGPSDRIEVASSGGGHFLVVLASSSFDGQPEEDRQELAWGRVLDRLDAGDQSRVDFIFTRTPAEIEEIRETAGQGLRSDETE